MNQPVRTTPLAIGVPDPVEVAPQVISWPPATRPISSTPDGLYRPPTPPPTDVKILIMGGVDAGKSSFVSTISEVESHHTDELVNGGPATTTVVCDLGRITITTSIVMHLFGMPGQPRFWYLWEHLAIGAAAAVVLIRADGFERSFAAIDFCERHSLPFVVALNPPHTGHRLGNVRDALGLSSGETITNCDARDRESVRGTLLILIRHLANANGTPVNPR